MYESNDLETQTCPTVNRHKTAVNLPVCISPFAIPGPVTVECAGEPVITSGYDRCCGTINGGCEYTISQTLNIDIPVVFGANVRVGDTYVNCNPQQTTDAPQFGDYSVDDDTL